MVTVSRIAILGFIGVVWHLMSHSTSANILPSPSETWAAALRLWSTGMLAQALGQSLTVYATGFSIACLIGVIAGLLMGVLKPLGKALEVFVFALAATPRVAFIPLIIVTLGLGIKAKVFVVFLGAVMPILINTYAGVLAADKDLIEMARSLGADRVKIVLQIILPGALPFVVTGLRLGATIGLINVVVAELYTAIGGLGGLLALYGNTFRMAEYFVIVLTLAAIGMCITEALRHIEARIGRWRSHA